MYNFPECIPCLLNQLLYVLDKCNVSQKEREEFYYKWVKKIAVEVPEKKPMEIATELHRDVRKKFNIDPFVDIKELSDTVISQNEIIIKNYFEKAQDLNTMLSLVISGNLIDIKTHDEVERLDIEKIMKIGLSKEFIIDHSDILAEKLNQAEKILYLGDNVGETYFDKYFISWLSEAGKEVTFAVRGDTVLNDATTEDAIKSGIDKVCYKLISNGYDAPGTEFDKSSEEFKKIFLEADLIISKGQGNLETLYSNNSQHIFFLLLTKCRAIANMMGTNPNDPVIIYNKKIFKNAYESRTKTRMKRE